MSSLEAEYKLASRYGFNSPMKEWPKETLQKFLAYFRVPKEHLTQFGNKIFLTKENLNGFQFSKLTQFIGLQENAEKKFRSCTFISLIL